MQRIHLALDQPLRRPGFSPIASKADVGSWWVELATAGTAALTTAGTLLTLGIARSKAKQEEFKAEQDRGKAAQELAKIAQEQAKTEQEEARASQEEAKAEAERLQLELARLELAARAAEKRAPIATMECDLKIAEFAAASQDPSETEALLKRAVEEIAGLRDEGAAFSLQRDAPAEVRAAFPAEALPAPAPGVRGPLPAARAD